MTLLSLAVEVLLRIPLGLLAGTVTVGARGARNLLYGIPLCTAWSFMATRLMQGFGDPKGGPLSPLLSAGLGVAWVICRSPWGGH